MIKELVFFVLFFTVVMYASGIMVSYKCHEWTDPLEKQQNITYAVNSFTMGCAQVLANEQQQREGLRKT